jgi:hypothetical protein
MIHYLTVMLVRQTSYDFVYLYVYRLMKPITVAARSKGGYSLQRCNVQRNGCWTTIFWCVRLGSVNVHVIRGCSNRCVASCRVPAIKYELTSLPRTLGTWVRIPLKAWISVLFAFFFVCVLLCEGRGLSKGWFPVQGVLPIVYRIRKLKKRLRPNKGL